MNSNKYSHDLLTRLHALRRLDNCDALYWAITIAIDFLLHASQETIDKDIERTVHSIERKLGRGTMRGILEPLGETNA